MESSQHMPVAGRIAGFAALAFLAGAHVAVNLPAVLLAGLGALMVGSMLDYRSHPSVRRVEVAVAMVGLVVLSSCAMVQVLAYLDGRSVRPFTASAQLAMVCVASLLVLQLWRERGHVHVPGVRQPSPTVRPAADASALGIVSQPASEMCDQQLRADRDNFESEEPAPDRPTH